MIPAGQTEKGDREIPEKGHENGRRALSRGAFVLPENGVPDPVIGLDAPMTANEREKSFGRGLFRGKAGDSVDHFRGGMTSIEFGGVAFEAEDLLVAGEGEVWKVFFQFGTDGEGAALDPTMSPIDSRGRFPRGKKPPRGGLRCLRTWWAGFSIRRPENG